MHIDESTKIKLFFENAAKNLEITDDRKNLLISIAKKIKEETLNSNTNTYLNFICTHNSRRSQLAQVWAYYAAYYFNLSNIKSYSGGTAVTAFFRNTVKTLQETGFNFQVTEFDHQNPTYAISFDDEHKPLIGYSKLFNDEYNSEAYFAITTCSSADENCPFIPEAIWRFHLPFNDPKEFDNTDQEKEAYLNASQQIAGEINFLFGQLKNH
jgi:arsenate reductase